MKLSPREMMLAGATALVGLTMGSWLLAEPLMARWKEAVETRTRLQGEQRIAEHLIGQREEWISGLAELRSQLPRHDPDRQVTADILRTVKKIADENRLILSRLEPDKEKTIGDLSEFAIDCTWDGDLESLVRFLYAVQIQGAMLDIRQLTVAPVQGVPGRLKGNFTLHYAFAREAPPPAASATPVEAPAAEPAPAEAPAEVPAEAPAEAPAVAPAETEAEST